MFLADASLRPDLHATLELVAAGVAIVLPARDGLQVGYANTAFLQLIGCQPGQAHASVLDSLFKPQADAASQRLAAALSHGRDESMEWQLRREDGVIVWVRASTRAVRDPQGQLQQVMLTLVDISSDKALAQAVQKVEQRWEQAVRATSDGLYEWDLLDGRCWYSRRFQEIAADSAEPLRSMDDFLQLLHPQDRDLVAGKIREHLETQARLDLRCRLLVGGQTKWCRLRGEAERDEPGRALRLAGSLGDISAQVQAEQALSRSQDFYGTVLDSLPLLIAYADHEQRIVYANRVFQQFFAMSLADLRGRSIGEVIGMRRHAAIAPYVFEALNGAMREGQGRFRDAGGRRVDMEAVFIPHADEAGAIQGCFVAARDITERRLLEAELRQSQKMEAVGRLTGGIAHDFNNLLSVIVGNLQLLSRSLPADARLLRQADTALNAALRGAELIRRLLAFARQQVLQPRTVRLSTSLSDTVELLRGSLTGDVELQPQIDADVWPARVDPGQLENAVLNLVINARDALPPGGVITLSVRNVSIIDACQSREDGPPAGDYVMLEVSDDGKGMSEDTRKRAFEPFFTTKDVGKGSGLGLSMVYGFMKQSGGYVYITSSMQQGTRVQLYFPRADCSEDSVTPRLSGLANLPPGNETLLVVEDNIAVRATAVDILGSLGYRVLQAGTAREALEQFAMYPEIALVFTDVMLPGGVLGTQLAQRLKRSHPGLRVLLTTGFNETSVLHRTVLEGELEVLPKPYQVEALAHRVRALLDASEESQRVPA